LNPTWYVSLQKPVKCCRRGLVFKAHRLLYHSTPGSRVIKKKKKKKKKKNLAQVAQHAQLLLDVLAANPLAERESLLNL